MSSEVDLSSKAPSFIFHTCLDINMLFSLCMSLSFSLSVAMKITIEGVLSVCVCVWEEIEVIDIPLLLQRTSRKKLRFQPKATWADITNACVCM